MTKIARKRTTVETKVDKSTRGKGTEEFPPTVKQGKWLVKSNGRFNGSGLVYRKCKRKKDIYNSGGCDEMSSSKIEIIIIQGKVAKRMG